MQWKLCHFPATRWLCPETCMWRLQFSLSNLEHKEVKVLCQLPQYKAKPFPFQWSQAAKHTWHIQNSCMPVMAHTPSPETKIWYVWESLFTVLRKAGLLLFDLSQETVFSSSNVQMSSMGRPGGSQWTGPLSILCTCHTVTWIPAFSILTSLPPSFSYIMNNAGWITDTQLTGQLTLAFYSKGATWTFFHIPPYWHFLQTTSWESLLPGSSSWTKGFSNHINYVAVKKKKQNTKEPWV